MPTPTYDLKGKGGYRGPTDARGLPPARAHVLDLVLGGNGSPTRLAETLACSRWNVCQHLAKLAAGGWIRAERTTPTGRVATWRPTIKALTADQTVDDPDRQAAREATLLQEG